MKSPAALARRPYTPQRLETLLTFAKYHPISAVHTTPTRQVLTTFAAPQGVFELTAGGRTALVAAVVDRMANVHDAALVEVLAWDDEVPFEPLLLALIPDAEAVGRAAGRPRLSLSLPAGLTVGEGWTAVEGSFVMERPAVPWPAPTLPEGAAWEDLAPEGVDEHYAVLQAAFAGDPGTMIPDRATFGGVALASRPPVRVLRRRGEEIGFARVSLESFGVGYVASIGRIPSARGLGLGPVVLAEALRMLLARGATRFRLGVTASNAAAVSLYERSGFTVVESWVTWHRALGAA